MCRVAEKRATQSDNSLGRSSEKEVTREKLVKAKRKSLETVGFQGFSNVVAR